MEKEYKKLQMELKEANESYYGRNESLMSDYDYDMKMKRLEEIEKEYPELKESDSVTDRVGSGYNSKFSKVKHSKPMLSLANVYSMEELDKFINNANNIIGPCEFVVEYKVDGLSISITYENGILKQALTRGDGMIGEDVTENIKMISSIPRALSVPIDIEVRGEVIMPKTSFIKANIIRESNNEIPFANCRNAAAGTLRQLDPLKVKERELDCYFYYILDDTLDSQEDGLEMLKKLGFKVDNSYKVCDTIGDLHNAIKEFENNRTLKPYDVDGAVIKLNNKKKHDALGFTSKFPKGSIAYKFETQKEITKLLSITWQVGRTGIITPVAELEPIFLAGTKVSRATLHNYKNVIDKDLRIGDMVEVEKAAEIIPHVIRSIEKLRTGGEEFIRKLDRCPACDSDTLFIDDGVHIKCSNVNCKEVIKRKIEHFVSRDAMNIEGLGPKMVESLLNNNIIRTSIMGIIDIYNLDENMLQGLDRMGERSINKLLGAIEESKKTPFHKVLYALGIPEVGSSTAKAMVNRFFNIDNLTSSSIEDIKRVNDIGDITAEEIYKWIHNADNISLISKLREKGVSFKSIETEITSNIFSDQTFCITGTFEKQSREKMIETIEQHGGIATNSVSKNTDWLLLGENPGSKLQKAITLGVKIMNEDEFYKLIR